MNYSLGPGILCMIGEKRLVGRSIRTGAAWGTLFSNKHNQSWPIKSREQAIMVRSKPKPKQEKREETLEEFVRRINQKPKHNGLKQQLKGARR